jgi:sugar phosphate permease
LDEDLKRTLRYRWIILWILAVQYLLVYFHRVSPAVAAPELIRAFGISGTQLGVFASAYFYSYCIMQIPVGILADAWGPKKVITLFSLIAALGAVLFGFSPNFRFAVISRIFVGLGVSAIFISSMRLLANWFRAIEFARVSGVLMAIGGAGWLAATTPLAFLMQGFGWRQSFIAIGIFSLIPVILTGLFVADTPEKKGLPNILSEPIGYSDKINKKVLDDLKQILREKHFWAIAIWFIFRGGALFGFFGLWAGPYLIDVYKLSKQTTGNILSMIAFAMIFLSPVLGHFSDKTLMSRKKVLVSTSILNSICWLFMLIFYNNLSIAGLYIVFFVMGITISSVGTIAIVATKEFFPPEIAGTSMGTMNIFPFIGGIMFQPLMGYVLDKTGKIQGMYQPSAYRLMVWILFITSLLSLISIMFSRETLKKTQDRILN